MKTLILLLIILSGCAGIEADRSYTNYGGTYTITIYDDSGGVKATYSDVIEAYGNEVGNSLRITNKAGKVSIIHSCRYTVEENR